MDVTKVKSAPATLTVELSAQEAVIVINALNEICNGIEVPEFSARIGADRAAAERLLADMKASASEVLES